MGLLSKRKQYSFSDILKGLHNAVNGAQEMLQAQQVQSLAKFWTGGDGNPLCQKVTVGDRTLNVPLLSLVSHSHLEMEDVEIKLKARIGDVMSQSLSNKLSAGEALTHSELQMELDGIKSTDDDVMDVTIRFKLKETPEGIARLTDEYNKLI